MEIRKEFHWDKVQSWKRKDPFMFSFIYPMDGKPFIIKGGLNDVKAEIKKIKDIAFVLHTEWWGNGTTYQMKEFINVKAMWCYRSPINFGEDSTHVLLYDKEFLGKPVKRIPRCFPAQLKQAIKNK